MAKIIFVNMGMAGAHGLVKELAGVRGVEGAIVQLTEEEFECLKQGTVQIEVYREQPAGPVPETEMGRYFHSIQKQQGQPGNLLHQVLVRDNGVYRRLGDNG